MANFVIPAHTKCSYWDECRHSKAKECSHKGEDHPVDYACGWGGFMKLMDEQYQVRKKVPIKVSEVGELK